MLTPLHILFLLLLISCSALGNAAGEKHEHAHHHQQNIAKDKTAPTMRLHLYRDVVDGYNLYIEVQNFVFALPVSKADRLTEHEIAVNPKQKHVSGHAHLYINNKKVGRVYGQYLHLPDKYFNKGINHIRINLNDDDHRPWAVQGKEIEAALRLDLKNEDPVIASYSNFAADNN